MTYLPWDVAWQEALYGAGGFYRRGGGPAAHFRTSVHAAPDLLAGALLTLAERAGLTRVVDVGAGRGELLQALGEVAGARGQAVELVGCDVVERPEALDDAITWLTSPGGAGLPESLSQWTSGALVIAHEWLDDVPCPVVQRDEDGAWRTVEVDPASGAERLGATVGPDVRAWLERWWDAPGTPPGDRAEVGTSRDAAWAALVAAAPGSLLVAVDYAHTRGQRPAAGTLLGYRQGGACPPVPDGGCDVTAHVAVDAVAAAGVDAGAVATHVTTQREGLRSLGLGAVRPSTADAATDPVGYLHRLSAASRAAELVDPAGLGAFHWLLQSTSRTLAAPSALLGPVD